MPVDTNLANWNKENQWHPEMSERATTPMLEMTTTPGENGGHVEEAESEMKWTRLQQIFCKSDESDSENTLLMDELLELCSWWEESEGPQLLYGKQNAASKGPSSQKSFSSMSSLSDLSDGDLASMIIDHSSSSAKCHSIGERVVLGDLANTMADPFPHQTSKKPCPAGGIEVKEPAKETTNSEDFWSMLDDIPV